MAKFEKALDNILELFEEVKSTTAIPEWVDFVVLSNPKQKELYKIAKANDLFESVVKIKTGDDLNLTVVINEEIFEQLPIEQQKLAIIECLSGVVISEEDVISVEKPNFNTYTGVLQRYGHEPIIMLHESIKSLFDAKKEKEDQEKAAKASKRKKN